jgi:hypothetical protein
MRAPIALVGKIQFKKLCIIFFYRTSSKGHQICTINLRNLFILPVIFFWIKTIGREREKKKVIKNTI